MGTRRNFPSYIERRRASAAARQAESDKLTPAQKLAKAVGAKEKAKYAKQVEAEQAKATTATKK
jgi:hypothetical protein